jgi:hypothetical protein
MLSNLHFVLKIIRELPRTEQTDLYLLLQDYMRGVPFPKPGEKFNPARCPHATTLR